MIHAKNKSIALIAMIVVGVCGVYLLSASRGSNEHDVSKHMVLCDAYGNTYNSAEEAVSAGLTPAQYGATYCPEYVAAQTGDYVGLSVAKAEEIARARGEVFRVVAIDGEPQEITADVVEGRINATVVEGVVVSFTVEGR
jgi:hypothetical protein